jgi:hypothetical protein
MKFEKMAHHQNSSSLARQSDKEFRFIRIQSERLFDKRIFSGFDCGAGHAIVSLGGCGYDNAFDLRVSENLVEVAFDLRVGETFGYA